MVVVPVKSEGVAMETDFYKTNSFQELSELEPKVIIRQYFLPWFVIIANCAGRWIVLSVVNLATDSHIDINCSFLKAWRF